MNKKKVAFHTLGCKLNFSETSTIARHFQQHNFERVDFDEPADIYVINTCSVTAGADKKCRAAVRKVIKKNKNAFVAVVGCYAQLQAEEIAAISGVNLVLGANEKFNILKHYQSQNKQTETKIYSCDIEQVDSFVSSFSAGDRTRSFLKIQDGCDYACTYCTIPLARGKSRNESIQNTVNEAVKISKAGVLEVVLTGINTGDFGRSTGENFFDLIKELAKVKGIARYRISSIEPNLLSSKIIDFVKKTPQFVPHFHIPLQSGSDKILRLMKRRYNRQFFEEKIHFIKKTLPDSCIGIDVIVGFPNETEEDFLDTYHFLKELPASYLHVFSYSERPDTEAVTIKNKLPAKEIARRSKMLQILSEKMRRRFYETQIGNNATVLWEAQNKSETMFGFTENYVKVETEYDRKKVNTLMKVRLTEILDSGNVAVNEL